MLILSRKPGESIVIDGRIKVTVVRVEGEVVKVGIEAPAEVPVHRQEVYDENPAQQSTGDHSPERRAAQNLLEPIKRNRLPPQALLRPEKP